jgi:microcystin-dependent protein
MRAINSVLAVILLGAAGILSTWAFAQSQKSPERVQLERVHEFISGLPNSSNLPVGTVAPFAGPKIPDGWLVCDGRTVNESDFPQLHQAIGELYGKGANAGEFKLPDYRGMFLRGVDPDKTVDKDRDARKAPSEASKNANYLGSVQSSATALPSTPWKIVVEAAGEHSHNIDAGGGRAVRCTTHGTVGGCDGRGDEWCQVWSNPDQNRNGHRFYGLDFTVSADCKAVAAHSHEASVSGGDGESRPPNVSVQYIIKAKILGTTGPRS